MQIYLLQEAKCKENPTDDLQVSIGKNSWYLKLSLFACRNLLAEDYGYRVHSFACKCGSERVFISGKETENMRYRCRECGNSLYLDASNVEQYGKEILRIDPNVVCAIEEKNASIRVYIEVPVNVDLAAGEKICYEKKKIAEITVILNRDIEMRYVGREKVTSDVIRRMESVLWRYIVEHYFHMHETVYHHVVHMPLTQLREVVSRLLRYPELKHSEFLFWVMDDEFYHNGGTHKQPKVFLSHICNSRVEKSVNRALYERYRKELERGRFYPLTPYIVCRAFMNPNYIVRLLKQQEFVLTRDSNYQSIALKAAMHLRFIDFLKERYGEKRLVKMFEKMGQDCSYWEDSVEIYANLFARELIENNFLTVRANVRMIHDELIRCTNMGRDSLGD